ncbi:MAG: hypothetical protein MJZ30_06145 [Paludibacteraceae bacterium]|nr:hypothetical protein [Paludibacteraceae bacterium]
MKKILHLLLSFVISAIVLSSCSKGEDAIEYRSPTVSELVKYNSFVMVDGSKSRSYTIAFGREMFTAYKTNNGKIDDNETFYYTLSGNKLSFYEKYNADRKYEATIKLYNKIDDYPNLIVEGSNLPSCMSAGDYVSIQ